MRKLMTAAVWLLVTSGLAGCFVLPPIPIPASGTSGQVVEQLGIGESSRADVRALLGEPNRLASPQHEVWQLKYDPLHIYFIMGIGGPGGGVAATEDPIYPGDTRRGFSRVVVEYDAQGSVARWSWENPGVEPSEGEGPTEDTGHGTSVEAPAPPEPVPVLTWTAQSFALSPDGLRAALLDASTGRVQIEIIELATGRRIAASRVWPEACGAGAITLGFDGTSVTSAPSKSAHGTGLCWWREEEGVLIAQPILPSDLAEQLKEARLARLTGRFLVLGQIDRTITVWDLAPDAVKMLHHAGSRYFAANAALSANGRVLALEHDDGVYAPSTFLLQDLTSGLRRVLTLFGPGVEPEPALALSPNGDIMAVHRLTHIEVWRLHRLSDPPVLETVLLPTSTATAALAFSQDGRRLVAASSYAQVWETHHWLEVGRAPPGTFSSALTPSDTLEISPDGSYLATKSGLWRIAPVPAQGGAGLGSPDRAVSDEDPWRFPPFSSNLGPTVFLRINVQPRVDLAVCLHEQASDRLRLAPRHVRSRRMFRSAANPDPALRDEGRGRGATADWRSEPG
jgi:hypothetical protein